MIEQADAWRADFWAIIKGCPDLRFQILTKRPERLAECLPEDWGQHGYHNVWLGVSVETQRYAEERVPLLLDIPAVVHFVSAEPLLGAVFLRQWLPRYRAMATGGEATGAVDWVIIGGESGNEEGEWKYRKCNPKWVADLVEEARYWGSAPFVKQAGSYLAKEWGLDYHGGGEDLGGDAVPIQWRRVFNVREWPAADGEWLLKRAAFLPQPEEVD